MKTETTPIVQAANEILRQIAKPVPLTTIGNAIIVKAIERMKGALDAAEDGVALAAPQIGELWQIFIISPRAFEENQKKKLDEKPTGKYLIFINPKITRTSRAKREMVEGCLSVRGIYGTTRRHERVSVEAYDEQGKKFSRHGSGLMAQIFQHEIDHLKGQLFTDIAKNLHEA